VASPLALVANHRGPEPVSVLLDEDELFVNAGGQRFSAKASVGFIDQNAAGIDGLLQRATFTTGMRKVLVLELRGADAALPAGPAIVELRGRAWLPGDDTSSPQGRELRVGANPL
jgi:hypothetical protein